MTDIHPDKAYEGFVQRNENWNYWVNTLDLTFYNLAMSFIYGATVLSLYASYLTDSAVLIGLIPAVQGIMFLLPQLLLARKTETLSRKKPLVTRISVAERLPYLCVGLAILLWPDAPRSLSYGILLAALCVATGSGGLAGPAWKTMLAKVVPVRRRGALFGTSSALGGVLGLGGAAVSRYVLANFAYPTSFAICFLLCFIFQVCSYACLSMNREPAREPEVTALPARAYWRKLPGLLANNPNFCRYLIGNTLLTFGMMGVALYIVYARRTFAISDAFAANVTMAALLGQSLSTPLMGRLADKRGNKWLLELGAATSAAAILTIALAPSAAWLYPAFMLVNASAAAMSIAGMGITMEFCSEDELPTFTALAGTLSGVPVLLAPILGGWITDSFGYSVLFMVAFSFSLVGWGTTHWIVRDPRHEALSGRRSARLGLRVEAEYDDAHGT